jgi:hypothetical protein
MTAPAWAAELRVTGFIDNVFPRFEGNNSSGDHDMTRNDDEATFGRTRGRVFFNFLASDDLGGVFGIEFDNTYGAKVSYPPIGPTPSTELSLRSTSAPHAQHHGHGEPLSLTCIGCCQARKLLRVCC